MGVREKVEELKEEIAKLGGGLEQIEKPHARRKLTEYTLSFLPPKFSRRIIKPKKHILSLSRHSSV